MKKDIVIVFDCGATNVRVIAIDGRGSIVAADSSPNNTRPDPVNSSWRIWDVNDIWLNMCKSSGKIMSGLDAGRVAGVTVTTFGVDGTLFDRAGRMLYPVISWQCERTVPIMAAIDKYIPLADLYAESGVLPFNFNTINKLIWFSEQRPDLVDKSHRFLFMPSVFSYFLTGEMVNDTTMAGTSMLTSLRSGRMSQKILGAIGFAGEKFGALAEPGTTTGKITPKASSDTGIPQGTPVVAGGHDTQFAIFGSGAEKNEPVLSSGTWEILMVRSGSFTSGKEQLEMSITTELDSRPGLYNIGNQWIASGILEWARKTFYNDVKENVYEFMISGAERVSPGSNGVKVIPKFYEELKGKPGGSISGLTMESTRDEIYRAMLEALSERLAEGKAALEKAGGFKTESILCVGGGSKNRLWNKLRAQYTGVPMKVIDQKETTVLGASFFVQAACGNASSPEEARKRIEYKVEIIEP
ncbi:MAG: L-fuculokinase [Bacteroidales bacterium]|nr:L-fuculokinase [Bacteroidales bacterium]MBN2632464.1 L-fuculokinase [Bacteroidales bacterium]